MTYHYAAVPGGAIYHITKGGRAYSLCGVWVRTGNRIYAAPPAGKKECRQCAKVLRDTTGCADPKQGMIVTSPDAWLTG